MIVPYLELVGFKRLDSFSVKFDYPFICMTLHTKFCLLDYETGNNMLISSDHMVTDKVRCHSSFDDNDLMYFVYKNSLCSLEM